MTREAHPRMRCVILTLFPEMVERVLNTSILGRARKQGLLEARVLPLRQYTRDRHQTVDDHPYGGGAGMVLMAPPIFEAVDDLRAQDPDLRLILLTPQGKVFTQQMAWELSREKRTLVFICGRYEGVDERVRLGLKPEEISIGDYVLTGGELAALVIIDAAARLIPGVVGDEASIREESFEGILDYPHYTRPAEYRGMRVPEVLRSGHHEAIRRWRRKEALRNTWRRRPDLLERALLTEEDRRLLDEIQREETGDAQ